MSGAPKGLVSSVPPSRWARLKVAWRGAPPQAVELKRGCVYVIEAEEELTTERFLDLRGYLEGFERETGCKFLVMDAGLHVAMNREAHGG